MRRYDDPVEVRRGQVGGVEAPEQFLWRGRLWKVRAVLARWTETGPWWASREVDVVLGATPADGSSDLRPVPDLHPLSDLLAERELWRVEAGRGVPGLSVDGPRRVAPDEAWTGVFELAHDDGGRWALVGCAD